MYICIYIHTHTHIYAHTYTYTHICMCDEHNTLWRSPQMYIQIFQSRYCCLQALSIEMENNWCQPIRNWWYQANNLNVVRIWKKRHICIHPDSAWNQSANICLLRTATVGIYFIGEIPPNGMRFRSPGAMYHARWMVKAFYFLKIWLFEQQFQLTKTRAESYRICLRLYFSTKAWWPCYNYIRLGCPGSLMSLYGPTFHVTPVDLCIIF